jgi:mRNA export factor
MYKVKHDQNMPVLDTCFSPDGSTVFSGGCDKAVRMWPMGGAPPPNGVAQQIGVHDAPVKGVGFLKSTNLVVSGGWDKVRVSKFDNDWIPIRRVFNFASTFSSI